MPRRLKLSRLPHRVRAAGGIATIHTRLVNKGATNHYQTFDFVGHNGVILFSVQATDFFDADGNFFEEDL